MADPPEGFRRAVLRGLAWKSTSRVLFEVTKLTVAVVLARLLTPEQYGLAGMVLVLAAFEPVLSGVALASVLVQRREVSEDLRCTVFWATVATGACSTVVGVALSGLVADFYGDAEVQGLFAAMSCCFVISALGMAQSHLLVREMDFRALELRAMAGVVVGAVLGIGAAAMGYGPWALVIQQLATYTTSTVLLWRFSPWRPRLRFSRTALRDVRGFGGHVSGTLLLNQLTQNTDNVLIGRYLGASALGAYALAYNIILVPFSRLSAPLHEVLYPVFSRLQDDRARLAALWLRVVRMVATLAVPAMLALVILAADVIDTVFGARWQDAVPVVRILAFVGMLLVLQGLNAVVLQAVGETRRLLHYSMAAFVAGLGAFILGLQWGITGVAACFAVVSTVMQPLYMALTARSVGASARDCVRALSGVVQASALMAAAVLVVHQLLVAADVAPPLRLVVCVLVGGAVYVPASAWRSRAVIEELMRLLRGSAGPAVVRAGGR